MKYFKYETIEKEKKEIAKTNLAKLDGKEITVIEISTNDTQDLRGLIEKDVNADYIFIDYKNLTWIYKKHYSQN